MNRQENSPMVRTTFRDELAELLAARATIFAKYWSEWQDLNLRPLVPNEALDHRTRYQRSRTINAIRR